jgi:hypothetical protein
MVIGRTGALGIDTETGMVAPTRACNCRRVLVPSAISRLLRGSRPVTDLRVDRALGVHRLGGEQSGLHELAVRDLAQFPLHRGPVPAAVVEPQRYLDESVQRPVLEVEGGGARLGQQARDMCLNGPRSDPSAPPGAGGPPALHTTVSRGR